MSSILNSISAGELQVQQVPEVQPVKEDSIIDLLQSSEIELDTCPKLEDNLEGINTGFGENNDLHYEVPCSKPELKTPLYQENYFSEFKTEEEKASARHALGLYNKGDVVAMSMLTADDDIPSQAEWKEVTNKQLKKGDKFFSPFTIFNSVFDASGSTLEERVREINSLLTSHQKELMKITQKSSNSKVTSLGDVVMLLQDFNNGENLHDLMEQMNQDMLRFDKTGQL